MIVRAADETEVLGRIERVRTRGDRLKGGFITLAYGAGGKASVQLVDQVFAVGHDNDTLNELTDIGVINLTDLAQQAGCSLGVGEKLAFSANSYMVNPTLFPGDSIGDLAVNGTINDLSVSGVVPFGIPVAFVIKEGLEVEVLHRVVVDMYHVAGRAGIKIVAGGTKVVPKGVANRLSIITAGVEVIPSEADLGALLVTDGDAIIISGPIADHGMTVILARGGLVVATPIETDSRVMNHLAQAPFKAALNARWMHDATRGGLATILDKLAQAPGKDVATYEEELMVHEVTRGTCDILGINPLYVVNEGVFVSIIPESEVAAALTAIQASPGGEPSAIVGKIVPQPASAVVMVTGFGGTRMVDTLVGDPPPRIC